MDWLVLAVAGTIAGLVYLFKTGSVDSQQPMLAGTDLIDDAIRKGIVIPLGLPDVATIILRVQSKLETGSWNSMVFAATNSLFNRHIGSGKGDWLGAGKTRANYIEGVDYYNAGPGDSDIRMFSDVYQSARDMRQLLQDGLYVQALAGLRRGSAPDYYNALGSAGFAADKAYADNLISLYGETA